MLSEIQYGSLVNYSPRGTKGESLKSRRFCGDIKAGKRKSIVQAINHFKDDLSTTFLDFLDKNTFLVPVPRSSPTKQDALWPSKEIADELLSHGFGKVVLPCLERIKAVPKSSSGYSAETRPSLRIQWDSLKVTAGLANPAKITLIDDVLTLGTTTFACALKLKRAFPKAEIRIFVFLRTKSLNTEIERFSDPFIGELKFNSLGKKVERSDR